ncbi:YxeA family protein [Staphylococcus auricularis]|uniref:YxeA family protein n=2 Tax=Staphylococcus auricularis TaxID=29379 RepID=UPI000D1BE8D7|nr:YxeA family protein [Staphylococcus auricularis]MCE5038088.1 YxeA family protein [Staphylococcus auricularis]MEB6569392.1 YxeA family protein [Staphylococcus auricularis]PTH26847.1 hypothetical protein BU608_03045 [Staphylococcus auricularis]
MKKLVAIITVGLLILVIIGILTVNKFFVLDYFNPVLKEKVSYAVVDTGTQQYDDVTIYSKDGKKRNYTLTFGGYDPSKKYVEIHHKGQYVKEIFYIDKSKMPKNVGD